MVIGWIDERGALARSHCGACVGWHLVSVQGQTVEAFHSSAEVSKWMRGPNGRRVQLEFWGKTFLYLVNVLYIVTFYYVHTRKASTW